MRWEIALLFAVNEERHFGKDGQFWVFYCPRKNVINSGNLDRIFNQHPLEITDSYMINCPYYQDVAERDFIAERRRLRQNGRFFIQPFENTLTPLESQLEFKPFLHKFTIDGKSKPRLREELGEITSDWAYYRHDDNIDNQIDDLNHLIFSN